MMTAKRVGSANTQAHEDEPEITVGSANTQTHEDEPEITVGSSNGGLAMRKHVEIETLTQSW